MLYQKMCRLAGMFACPHLSQLTLEQPPGRVCHLPCLTVVTPPSAVYKHTADLSLAGCECSANVKPDGWGVISVLTQNCNLLLHAQVKRLEQQEKDLQAAVSNKLNTFGPSTAELLEGIEDNSQHFHRQPVGPLGHLMSLSDNRYATCLDAPAPAITCFSDIRSACVCMT